MRCQFFSRDECIPTPVRLNMAVGTGSRRAHLAGVLHEACCAGGVLLGTGAGPSLKAEPDEQRGTGRSESSLDRSDSSASAAGVSLR